MERQFQKSQRFRVICNGVCFYTTKRQILNNVGDFTAFNDALRLVLTQLEELRRQAPLEDLPVGVVQSVRHATPYDIQLTVAHE